MRYGVKLAWLLLLVVLVGCSSTKSSRYSIENDHGPSQEVDVSRVPDAVPRVEPLSRGGNKSPYQVLGKTYYVMPASLGYKEQGVASWYGKKFHGHQTSNGEVYNMYGMSAAHKSLPLPTFVKVTNLANQRSVIVRVNDRGPFHGGRVIDLSYAAAKKLDMLGAGTARVEVEAIDPRNWNSSSTVVAVASAQPVSRPLPGGDRYLQVAAFSLQSRADETRQQLQALLPGHDIRVAPIQRNERVLYRVQIGPVRVDANLAELVARVEAAGYLQPHLVE